jgi:hypothetical protein
LTRERGGAAVGETNGVVVGEAAGAGVPDAVGAAFGLPVKLSFSAGEQFVTRAVSIEAVAASVAEVLMTFKTCS